MPNSQTRVGAWRDPHLSQGQEFNVLDLGNNNILALCPFCYRAAMENMLANVRTALSGNADQKVNWNSVNWNSVNWNSVNWNSVNWNSVNWNSVNWNSVNWNSVNWNSVNWNS